MTQKFSFGLVGHKISYTLSPRIFAALFDKYGVDGEYSVIDAGPDEFVKEIETLRQLDGFSVTVPYKRKVLSFISRLSPEAEGIGAVNSVRVEQGQFFGYNTDADAFMSPLKNISPNINGVLLMGHGGAAGAVLWGLVKEFPGCKVVVCGRDLERAEKFVGDCMTRFKPAGSIEATTFDMINAEAAFGLIVNCTPLGGVQSPLLSPLPRNFKYAGKPICYDLLYCPVRTQFMSRAQNAGCRVIGGFPMLVRQAVHSWTIWTGSELDIDDVSGQIMSKLDEENKGEIS